MYGDPRLDPRQFPGARMTGGHVIVVKTHKTNPPHIKHFDKAVLLLREPYGTLKVLYYC